MDTKQRILDEALTLFSEKGYANVYVSEIAERVGIRAPSLYKHYPGKQAIFDAIIEEMHRRFIKQAVDSVPAMEEMLDRSFMSEKSKAKYKENIRDRAKALSL